MPVLPEKNILWFDISIDNVVLMEIRKSKKDFDDIKPGYIFGESFIFFDESEEFSSRAIFYNKDEKFGCFECKFHFYEKRVLRCFHDVSFVHDDIFLFVFYDHFFVDYFHGVELAIFLETTEIHF